MSRPYTPNYAVPVPVLLLPCAMRHLLVVVLVKGTKEQQRAQSAVSPKRAAVSPCCDIDPGAGSHGMQRTGGAVELVERSEGGLGVPCSATLFVLPFRG